MRYVSFQPSTRWQTTDTPVVGDRSAVGDRPMVGYCSVWRVGVRLVVGDRSTWQSLVPWSRDRVSAASRSRSYSFWSGGFLLETQRRREDITLNPGAGWVTAK